MVEEYEQQVLRFYVPEDGMNKEERIDLISMIKNNFFDNTQVSSGMKPVPKEVQNMLTEVISKSIFESPYKQEFKKLRQPIWKNMNVMDSDTIPGKKLTFAELHQFDGEYVMVIIPTNISII